MSWCSEPQPWATEAQKSSGFPLLLNQRSHRNKMLAGNVYGRFPNFNPSYESKNMIFSDP